MGRKSNELRGRESVWCVGGGGGGRRDSKDGATIRSSGDRELSEERERWGGVGRSKDGTTKT